MNTYFVTQLHWIRLIAALLKDRRNLDKFRQPSRVCSNILFDPIEINVSGRWFHSLLVRGDLAGTRYEFINSLRDTYE